MRRGSTILACELPWYLKRRAVVSSWRAYKQSTYLVNGVAARGEGAAKGQGQEEEGQAKSPSLLSKIDQSDSEGEPSIDEFEVDSPVVPSASEAAKSMPCRAYGIVYHRLALLVGRDDVIMAVDGTDRVYYQTIPSMTSVGVCLCDSTC